MVEHDIIVAPITGMGEGVVSVIRVSGKGSIELVDQIFVSNTKDKKLANQKTQTIHLGEIRQKGKALDEVLASLFRAPNSYTGEDVVELSCHGSFYIQKEMIHLIIKKGARVASPGEFTKRAFLNGKMDLTQAEAVADLIASESQISHEIAMNQMRGGFTSTLQILRNKLIEMTSLLELELDFAEEDVEFADRSKFLELIQSIESIIFDLKKGFSWGNALKKGIPVAIAGKPNAGKSSLLNAMLQEEKAIVSDIPGTTRDSLEDILVIDGFSFRLIDTAGLRETHDTIEAIGVNRALNKISEAKILLYVYDLGDITTIKIQNEIKRLSRKGLSIYLVQNKIDQYSEKRLTSFAKELEERTEKTSISISTFDNESVQKLKNQLAEKAQSITQQNDLLLTSARHFEALNSCAHALQRVREGLNVNISGELISIDVREALRYLGSITGEIDIDEDILGTIFGKFCIGK